VELPERTATAVPPSEDQVDLVPQTY
jgi:hypothetical protein